MNSESDKRIGAAAFVYINRSLISPRRPTEHSGWLLCEAWPSLIKIYSAQNQDIIMVYEAMIKVDIYGVGLANTGSQL